jgi:hypothetical protein
MRHAACSPRFCHRRPSPPVVAPPASSVLPFLQLGNHAPWPTAANGLWGEVNSWPPDCCGAARSTSAQSTAVSPPSFHCPRKPSALVEPPKNSLLPSGRRRGLLSPQPRRVVSVRLLRYHPGIYFDLTVVYPGCKNYLLLACTRYEGHHHLSYPTKPRSLLTAWFRPD